MGLQTNTRQWGESHMVETWSTVASTFFGPAVTDHPRIGWMFDDVEHRPSVDWQILTVIKIYPIGSMYGIYANIWGILMVNVTIYHI